jgi:hypothetical protein
MRTFDYWNGNDLVRFQRDDEGNVTTIETRPSFRAIRHNENLPEDGWTAGELTASRREEIEQHERALKVRERTEVLSPQFLTEHGGR